MRRARDTASIARGTAGRIRSASRAAASASTTSGRHDERGIPPAEAWWGPDGQGRLADEDLLLRFADPPPSSSSSSRSGAVPGDGGRSGIGSIPSVRTLESLGEVDFGPDLEGRSADEVRAGVYETYGRWSIGDVDRRINGQGESGREVLTRAASALTSLAEFASNGNGGGGGGGGGGRSVLAVSHSAYLRMLLALALDVSPARAAVEMKLENCSVCVLDVNASGKTVNRDRKSGIVGVPA